MCTLFCFNKVARLRGLHEILLRAKWNIFNLLSGQTLLIVYMKYPDFFQVERNFISGGVYPLSYLTVTNSI